MHLSSKLFKPYFKIMVNLQLTHEQHGLILDMFASIADLGIYDDPCENEQDSCPDLFDKTWDAVIEASS